MRRVAGRALSVASLFLGLVAVLINAPALFYMSFALMAWFFSSTAFMIATAVVVLILYNREFRSDVLQVLKD
jgi:uncharacterized membrane protein